MGSSGVLRNIFIWLWARVVLTTWLVKVCTGIYRYIPVYTVIYYATLRKSVFWYEKVYTISYQVWKFRNFSYVVWDGMRKYGYETVWNSMKQYETVWNEMYEVCTSKKGLSFISNRQRRKEGTLRASGVGGDRTHAGPPQWSRVCPP